VDLIQERETGNDPSPGMLHRHQRKEERTNNNNTTPQNPKIKNQNQNKTQAKDRVCEQKFWQRPPQRTH